MSKCKINENWILAQQKTREYSKKEKQLRIDVYNLNPTRCLTCESPFSYEKRKNKFCNHSCAAKHNNIGVTRHKNENSVRLDNCLCCNTPLSNRCRIYCNTKCQKSHEYNKFITLWLSGLIIITSEQRIGYIRKYLFDKYDSKCSICGWNSINPSSGKCPLNVEHINGIASDNSPSNLTLLCPNCHSLTPTFGALNKGNGRKYRRDKYLKNTN